MDRELRNLDIKIAKAMGFKIERGCLYSPSGVFLGGNYMVHRMGKPLDPDTEAMLWDDYTPHFSSDMRDAMYLLDRLNDAWGISYNLFLENDLVYHTAEIGYWNDEAGKRDELWTGCEKTPAHAIAQAVVQCPILMGENIEDE